MDAELPHLFRQRIETDPDSVQRDLFKLVLTIIELLRQLMEAQALRRVDEAYGMAARSVNAVKRFNTLMEDLRTVVESGAGPATVLEAILERTGYLAELQASTDPQDETRIENLAELVAVAREFDEARAETGEVNSLEDFLEQVSLVADADEIPDSAEAEEAGLLEVPVGTPVLRHSRRALLGDKPVEVSRTVYRHDRHTVYVQLGGDS